MKGKIVLVIILILLVILGIIYYPKFANKDNVNTNKNKFVISFKEETYKSYKKNGELTFENKRNLPEITNEKNQDAADKIVKSLTSFSDKAWENIKKASDEYKESPYMAGVEYLFSTYLEKDNYLVFKAVQSGNFGGVSWNAEEFYNYDAKTGELLTLKNITTDYTNLKKVISDKVRDYINKNIDDVLVPDIDQSISDILDQDGNWGFTETGINIQLPKYSIGSGADGVRTVEIDKADVNPYLLEKYMIK